MVITRSYGVITRSYKREREGVGTIGLDWLGRGWRGVEWWGWGIPAGLVPSAHLSWPLSPHSTSSLSLPYLPSTSI